MATSPNYGWLEPDNTDLVKNGALAIRTLGNAIDTTMATMTPKSIVDAKGDLIAASAADTPARLAVGNNGETLVADSSTSTGLSYQANFAAGKNKIINGDFGIWQRGTSFSNPAASSYLADRFQINYDVAAPTTNTVTQEAFTLGTAPEAGYESQYFLRSTLTTVGTNTGIKIQQRIEDVRTFANEQMTFSFWAKADSNRTLSAISIVQVFGSGGSASVVTNFTTSTQAITTSWARYNFTVAVPSISGKTLGAGSYLMVRFTQPAAAGCVVDTWGWQVEAGSVATAFQTATGTIQGELAACQRYYFRSTPGGSYSGYGMGGAFSTTQASVIVNVPVQMRSTVTVDYANLALGDGVAATALTALAIQYQSVTSPSLVATVASGLTQYRVYQLQNNANTAGYLALSSEL